MVQLTIRVYIVQKYQTKINTYTTKGLDTLLKNITRRRTNNTIEWSAVSVKITTKKRPNQRKKIMTRK